MAFQTKGPSTVPNLGAGRPVIRRSKPQQVNRVEPGPCSSVQRAIGTRPTTARWPKSRCTQHSRAGLVAVDGQATKGCWWWSSPAILAAASSMPRRHQRGPARPGGAGRTGPPGTLGFAAPQTQGISARARTGDSPAIALDFLAGPRSAEGFCPLYDPRRSKASGRTEIAVALNGPSPAQPELCRMPPPHKRPPVRSGRNGLRQDNSKSPNGRGRPILAFT